MLINQNDISHIGNHNITLPLINKVPFISDIDLPGSKSIANRVLLLASIAQGTSTIHNIPNNSEDVRLMIAGLRSLGVNITRLTTNQYNSSYKIIGADGRLPVRKLELFCGNSGTMMRFLTGVLAIVATQQDTANCLDVTTVSELGKQEHHNTNVNNYLEYHLTGIERMQERPIADLVNTLRQCGATIDYTGKIGYPPLKIISGLLNQEHLYNYKELSLSLSDSEDYHFNSADENNSIDYSTYSKSSNNGEILDTLLIKHNADVSSQYLSAILMGLPLLHYNVIVQLMGNLISASYVDITIQLLELFGVIVQFKKNYYIINKFSQLHAVEYTVEPDASTASYFLAMAAIRGSITINKLGTQSLQGDKNFANILKQMGAIVNCVDHSITVSASSAGLVGISVDMLNMPDTAMTIAVLALFANGATTIKGIHSWKFKETDRLYAMHCELSKLGAVVQTDDNSITIIPPKQINEGIIINTYNDHRMAMCFSLLAARVRIVINNPDCVNKTFAGYFNLFKQLYY